MAFPGLTLDPFHHQEGYAVLVKADRVDWHDVRVVEEGRDHRLADEPLLENWIVAVLCPEPLHGDFALEGPLPREIDDSHPAFTEGITDPQVRSEGVWKIQKTGYERTYEEIQMRDQTPGLRMTASRWQGDGSSELDV